MFDVYIYTSFNAALYDIVDLSTLDDILQRCLSKCTLHVSSRTLFATKICMTVYLEQFFRYEPK